MGSCVGGGAETPARDHVPKLAWAQTGEKRHVRLDDLDSIRQSETTDEAAEEVVPEVEQEVVEEDELQSFYDKLENQSYENVMQNDRYYYRLERETGQIIFYWAPK